MGAVLLVAVLSVLAFTGILTRVTGYSSYQEIYTRRYDLAVAAKEANIAVVYAKGEEELFNGVELAFAGQKLTLKNANPPKTLSVKLTPVVSEGDFTGIEQQVAQARSLARDEKYVAVIGHSTSDSASRASVSYEYTKLLFMATTDSDPSLTDHGFGYTFRNIGTDVQLARAVATLCSRLGVKRVGVFYERSTHALGAIDDLEGSLDDLSIETIFQKPYEPLLGADFGSAFDRRQRLAQLQDQVAYAEHLSKQSRPQMIAVIGDGARSAVELWKRLSISGLKDVPIVLFGGPLDSFSFLGYTRRATSGGNLSPILLDLSKPGDVALEPGAIYVASEFSSAEVSEPQPTDAALMPDALRRQRELRAFAAEYTECFKNGSANARFPGALAMRGYTAGTILKQAMERSVSIAPVDVQETLKSTQITFETLGRSFQFQTDGNVKVERLGAPGAPLLFKKFSPAVKPAP